MSVEPIARLPESKEPQTAPNLKIQVWITEAEYVGLHALLHWLKGFEASGAHGVVPGHHELTAHFRSLTASIRDSQKIV